MTPTIEQVSSALVDGFTTLDADEQRLAVAVFRLLAAGRPASADVIAAESGWPVDLVGNRLNSWPAVFRDHDGAVVGFWGLAAEPVTNHRIDTVGIGTAWTWCSYDTLFITHLLGATARISSRCPVTGVEVRLTVTPEGVTDVEPPTAVVSLLTPDGPFDDNVRRTFCHYVLFFAEPDAAERWIADHPGTFSLSVTDAFDVARRQNAAVFAAVVGDRVP